MEDMVVSSEEKVVSQRSIVAAVSAACIVRHSLSHTGMAGEGGDMHPQPAAAVVCACSIRNVLSSPSRSFETIPASRL